MNIRGPFYFITKKAGKAIWDYKMLGDGDKVIVAVSGGKDSLCLLKILQERLKFVPINYEIIACHVDMGFSWVNTDILAEHFEKEGLLHTLRLPKNGRAERMILTVSGAAGTDARPSSIWRGR